MLTAIAGTLRSLLLLLWLPAARANPVMVLLPDAASGELEDRKNQLVFDVWVCVWGEVDARLLFPWCVW